MLVSHGCHRVHVEKLKPGGFGASMMRVVFGVRDNWLFGRADYAVDTALWSYRCRANGSAGAAWAGCYFDGRALPCAPPPVAPGSDDASASGSNATLQGYRREESKARGRFKGMHSVWVRPPTARSRELAKAAAEQVAAVRKLDPLSQLRWIAAALFRPTPDASRRIDARLASLGVGATAGAPFGPSRDYVTLHFRRGDKVRESKKKPMSGADVVHFVKHRWAEAAPQRVIVLTDDIAAVDEIRAAAPQWDVRTLADPSARGFNECLLPSVRKVRRGACDCARVAEKAKEGVYPSNVKQRTYCFVNPSETDPAKLVSVLDAPLLDQEEAGFAVLADVAAATRSKYHVAVGCGSNVDKLVHLLRGGDPSTSVCIGPNGAACTVNVNRWSVSGVDCECCE